LAADFQKILESGRGDEGRPRAFSLEQSVGRDGGTVDYVDLSCTSRSLVQTCEYHLRWRARIRPEFERFQTPIVVKNHEIGERAARVDANPH
jgi:hypothetical protein